MKKNLSKAQEAAHKARTMMLEIERDKNGNPVTLEGVVRSMILKSPDYCQYRDDALNTIYCVLGSGIDWNKHGRLGDCSPNNYMNMPPDTCYGPWSDEFGRADSLKDMTSGLSKDFKKKIIDRAIKDDNRRLDKSIVVINEIDERCETYRPNRTSWYPISWYSCHLCVPVNAQEDFLHGAIETAALIVASEDFYPPMDRIGSHHRTVNFAKGILPILKMRVNI